MLIFNINRYNHHREQDQVKRASVKASHLATEAVSPQLRVHLQTHTGT
jgi:hypothetical protein